MESLRNLHARAVPRILLNEVSSLPLRAFEAVAQSPPQSRNSQKCTISQVDYRVGRLEGRLTHGSCQLIDQTLLVSHGRNTAGKSVRKRQGGTTFFSVEVRIW